jgi:NADPH2:quinone reductase
MKVVRVHEYGGPEALRLDDLPLPEPAAGQVLVAVKAAGVNLFDTQLRSGLYRFGPLPVALGNEGAGVVQAVGPGVTEFRVGDRVTWILAPGSYATHALVPAQWLIALPDTLTFEQAAAGLFQGLTAHYLAFSAYELKGGDTCIVHSAAGGVGLLLCQMAKKTGARVIGLVSTDEKVKAAREAGADAVFVYNRDDWAKEAKRLTDGRGVDVVYDAVGLDTYQTSIACLRRRGLLALYGEASGLVPPIDVRTLLFAGSVYLTRTGLNDYATTREEYLKRASDVLGWIADGSLRVRIDRAVPLSAVADAHRAIESRGTIGKILLLT